MSETKKYIQALFTNKNILIAANRNILFEEYVTDESNINAVKQIQENQKMITDKWMLKNKIKDIIDKQLVIPNATINKPYEATLNFVGLGMNDIVFTEFDGLSLFGLEYNNETKTIKGIPTQSGDFKVKLKFRVSGEANDSGLNEKTISLIINADPKTLWKNIPSKQTEDNYWKPDTAEDFQPLGNKHIVVASKRGRSHANGGSFRDDDFAFKYFEKTGWSIVCVADGAGSCSLSREGSKLACNSIVKFFETTLTPEMSLEFDELITRFFKEKNNIKAGVVEEYPKAENNEKNEHKLEKISDGTEELQTKTENNAEEKIQQEAKSELRVSQKISHFVYNNLSKAAVFTHRQIAEFATKNGNQLKDFHSTLIFALFKKYEFGYAILTFGVGDCPIGLLNKEMTDINLMNWLDVGEFGGGTRFITMPEIFNSDKFPTRFGFKLIDDFSYLMLMTDGIYDAKFVVEANLEKIEKWKEFIDDLEGKNEDAAKVEFDPKNEKIASQLSTWMDFWSPGNHDDRTLAIVF